MPETVIPFGSPLAAKVFGAAVFAECSRTRTFSTNLTGPAPAEGEAAQVLRREQTAATYPFVRVMDLQKGQGDTVQLVLFNIVTGKPVMGDKPMAGKRLSLSHSEQDIKINQMRFGVDPGGRMTQQRTLHDLRTLGKAAIEGLVLRCDDQRTLVHCAGARGDQNTADWIVPLESDPDYAEIMVNPVRAPSFNRHIYAGDARSIDEIDNTDIITLDTIDMLRAINDEADIPLQPIMLPDDPAGQEKPLLVLYITTRQWHWLQTHTNATTQTGWRTFMANARERGSKNPIFTGEAGLWNGILVKPMGGRAIRFHQGSRVTVAQNTLDYTTTTVEVPTWEADTPPGHHAVDRALLMGAQALCCAYGKHSKSGLPMSWWEGEEDDGNKLVASVSGMGGIDKIHFKDVNGRYTDHGIMPVDSYAPNPQFVRL